MEKNADGMERSKSTTYVFRLYVTGMTPRSVRAIENIKALCEQNLKGRYQLEIIDIYQQPELAREAQIVAAPTLVKNLPLPLKKFIGDLSDDALIKLRLDLKDRTCQGPE